MMNDRELLELAAKSIGKKINEHADQDGKFRFVEDGVASWGPGYWNPLDDDGDALRLSAALRLSIFHGIGCTACASYKVGRTIIENGISPADTRRAIVRAAAEIGKAMQEKH